MEKIHNGGSARLILVKLRLSEHLTQVVLLTGFRENPPRHCAELF